MKIELEPHQPEEVSVDTLPFGTIGTTHIDSEGIDVVVLRTCEGLVSLDGRRTWSDRCCFVKRVRPLLTGTVVKITI